MAEKNKPSLVFIMETKIRSSRIECLKRRVDCEGCFTVDAVGKGGGLALFWNINVGVEIVNYFQRHINAWIMDEGVDKRWLLTCYYGQPETTKRKESWNLLKSFKPQTQVGWCVVGDFNEILVNSEKEGGRVRPEGQMVLFREALTNGNLYDLGWKGDRFTWSNLHADESFTKERLDRAVANPEWREEYKESWVEVLVSSTSNHKLLLVHVQKQKEVVGVKRRSFKYEANWALEDDCELVIKTTWKKEAERRNPSNKVVKLLDNIKVAFQKWSKKLKNGGKRDIDEKSKLLQRLQEDENRSNANQIRRVKEELNLLLDKEDLRWR